MEGEPGHRPGLADAHLIHAALEIHDGAPEFGYRLVADELSEHGISAGENRVHRLCTAQRIWSLHSKKRGLNRKAGPPVHDDLLAVPGGGRDFTAPTPTTRARAAHPNRVRTAPRPARNRGLINTPHESTELGQSPVLHRPVESGPFRSRKMHQALTRHDMVGSMGQVSSAGDKAAMESFFSLLQRNVLNRQSWRTREQYGLRSSPGSKGSVTAAGARPYSAG
ncbi:MAG: transposase [Pseudonocardiales bacterium]|nr:transposase [Pseudonocardiales bacterium]